MTDAKAQLAAAIKACQDEVKALGNELNKQRPGATPLNEVSKTAEEKNVHAIRERKLLKGHFGKIYALHWCPNDEHFERLVSASQDGKLIIWNSLKQHKLNMVQLASAWVMTVAYAPSAKYVACGGLDNVCSIYSLDTTPPPDEKAQPSKPVVELSGQDGQRPLHDGYLSCCRFLSDQQMITSSGDTTCVLWDVGEAKQKINTIFEGHEQDVMSLAVSPANPNIFVSGGVDTEAKVWDMRAANTPQGSKIKWPIQSHEGHNSDINSITMFSDGWSFATGSDDFQCKMWDIRSWCEINSFGGDAKTVNQPVTSLDFSKSGKYLFAGYDDQMARVWDTVSAKLMTDARNSTELKSHEKRISCLGVNKNGTALATGSWDSMLRVWA